MVRYQKRLLFGVVLATAAFVPLDLAFGATQTAGLIVSRLLLVGGFGGAALLFPLASARAKRLLLAGVGAIAPVAVAVMCTGTGGTSSPAFAFMWALPVIISLVCLEEPLAAATSTGLSAVCGAALLLSEGHDAARLAYFVMVTLTCGALAVASTVLVRKSHRAELEKLREQEELSRALIDAMPAAVLVADANGRGRYSNPLADALLAKPNVAETYVSGMPKAYQAFVTGTDRPYPREETCMVKALQGESVTVDDIEVVLPNGQRRDLEVRGAPLLGADGKVQLGITVFLDITERRRAEAALKHANERLAQAERISSLGTLAAGVAHEINNPLMYITTNLAFALDDLKARQDPLYPALHDVQTGVFRVRDIVRDLRTFSRSQENAATGPSDLGECLESALGLASNELRHRARVVTELGPVPRVIASEARLVQVFVNLLTNAAQAIPEGQVDANTITVRTWVDARGHVVAEVQDTGQGIEPHVLPRIFEPFFTTKPVGVGTGLGLAICHGIVRNVGGELEVETQVGKGSTFRVRLPAAPQAGDQRPVPAPPVTAPSPGPGRRPRVLVIDDDPLVGPALQRTLEIAFDVTHLTDPRGALERLVRGEPCDAVICDMMMPNMPGYELFAQLQRARPELAERVIFTTGGAFTPKARQFFEGAKYRLEKPFAPEELRALLREVLDARHDAPPLLH